MTRSDRHKIYQAIEELHQEKEISISLLCKIANICRQSYYKWKTKEVTKDEKLNEKLSNVIQEIHNEVKGIYGYRRMTMNIIAKTGEIVNHKRIYRLMNKLGLSSVIRKKRKKYVAIQPEQIAENILNRKFQATFPNEKWVTDVTEFKYGDGKKAYLSAILDLYDRSIVSYVLSHRNDNPLVFKTLDLAITRNPMAKGLLHSDRGYQYTSKGFKVKLDAQGIKASMSRVGRCIDNGPMEGFWGSLKSESYYLKKIETYEELELDIKEYINFYNTKRLQKKLNSLSPLEYRAQAA